MEAEDAEVDLEEAPPVDSDGSVAQDFRHVLATKTAVKRNRKKALVIVESEVRRSPRLQKNKKGFKSPTCKVKGCLGCNSAPPSISKKAIRKLSASFYDIDVSQVTNNALSKKTRKAPVGPIPRKKKNKGVDDEPSKEKDA